MKINSIRYVFENKQPELRRVIVKYGLPPATNSKDLWKKINYLVAKFKDEMLRDIAEIHPDRELILWSESKKNSEKPNLPEIPLQSIMNTGSTGNKGNTSVDDEVTLITTSRSNVKNKYSGVCGCSGADGDEYSNCNGNNCTCGCGNKNQNQKFSSVDAEPTATITDKVQKNLPVVVIGSLLIVGVLLAMKD